MTNKQKEAYKNSDALKKIFVRLKDRKFRLDCGHHVTFGYYLGNDILIRNGKKPEIICIQCGY